MKRKSVDNQKTSNHYRIFCEYILTLLISMVFLILLILSFSISWVCKNFANIGFDEIMFTMSMPLEGTSQIYIKSFLYSVIFPSIGILVEICLLVFVLRIFLSTSAKWKHFKESFLFRKDHKKHIFIFGCYAVVILCWSGVLFWQADRHFQVIHYIKNHLDTSSLIEDEYIDPNQVEIVFPENKRNLIYILVESGETSTQDVENGGIMPVNYTPEMTALAKEGISFSQSDLLVGASVAPDCSWTMAGMVAETAGLPLKIFYNGNNSMNRYSSFMPTTKTLGDILQKEGYQNVYMAGSDFTFGGRTNYCREHGDYLILDYEEAQKEGVIDDGYRVWWGFEDQILYRWAKEELLQLAESGQPFNFSMLTVDTHAEDGYVCAQCKNTYSEQYANVWKCASEQLFDFVSWIREQDFYENTTVVIIGDHCSMDTDFYPDDSITVENEEKDEGQIDNCRGVYNVFLNTGIKKTDFQEKNREFTTLDFFPTILASIGAEIEGNRLGLGTNLFSETQTLSEKYGYEYLFSELAKRSVFYDKEIMFINE